MHRWGDLWRRFAQDDIRCLEAPVARRVIPTSANGRQIWGTPPRLMRDGRASRDSHIPNSRDVGHPGLFPTPPRSSIGWVGFVREGVGEEVLQRGVLLLAEFGVRERFAREHLVAHGCVVDEDRLDCCGLFQVAGLEVLVDVLIGVVGFGFVVERVLDELEAGDADRVEGEMVGAAGVAQGEGGDAEVVEGLDPLGEDGRDEGVLLEIDAADFA